MKLDPTVVRKVQKKLGRRVPAPTSDAYASFVEQLRLERPELARTLEGAVILESLGDPRSRAERRARTAERLRSLKRRLVYRYDELQSGWFLSRPKIALLGVGLVAILMGVMFVGSLRQGAGAVKAQAETALAFVGQELGFGAGYSADLGHSPPEMVVLVEETPPAPEAASPLTSAPPSPLRQAQAPETISVPRPLQPVQVFSRVPSADARVFSREVGVDMAPDPFGAEGPEIRPLVVFRQAEAPRPLRVSSGMAAQPGLATFGRETNEGSEAPRSYADTGDDIAVDPFAQAEVEATDATTSGPFSPAPGVAPRAATLPTDRTNYQPGEVVAVTLAAGVVTLADETAPVVARGEDGSRWQGTARLEATGRFSITFNSVTRDGLTQHLTGQAIGQDGFAGVPATVRETTPALASDLLRGAMRGVGNYVDALGSQRTVTVDAFGKEITQIAPSLEAQIAGSLSRLFTPQVGQQVLVRVAELASGTQFDLMVF